MEKRCSWCLGEELYERYHDEEWGVSCRDGRTLFEMLNLEGAQAGLSWITILRKRDNYRRLFANFEADKVAIFTEHEVDQLVQDAGIVRHRGKIEAVIANAQALLKLEAEGESFVEFLWSFVEGTTVINRPRVLADVPSKTDASTAMSRALKKRGFKFVGPTTCYAFMQASGMVNDHLLDCPSR